jgi:hypothetical protein
MSLSRAALAAVAWIFVVMVVVQVFLAGIGLFGSGDMGAHVEFGYLVVMMPILVLIAAAVARAGRLAWISVGLVVLGIVQSILPWFRDTVPFVAALHPVNALALFWLGLFVARRATGLARDPHPRATPAEGPAAAGT